MLVYIYILEHVVGFEPTMIIGFADRRLQPLTHTCISIKKDPQFESLSNERYVRNFFGKQVDIWMSYKEMVIFIYIHP